MNLKDLASEIQSILDWQEECRDALLASYFHHKAQAKPGNWHKEQARRIHELLWPETEYPTKLKDQA